MDSESGGVGRLANNCSPSPPPAWHCASESAKKKSERRRGGEGDRRMKVEVGRGKRKGEDRSGLGRGHIERESQCGGALRVCVLVRPY